MMFNNGSGGGFEDTNEMQFGANNQFFSRRDDGSSGFGGADIRQMENLEMNQRAGINEFQEKMDNRLMAGEARDKMRLGGNYLNIKEDKAKYSGFHVLVSGHIESAQINEYDGICAKYDFIAGSDWSIVEGNRTGVSQHAYKSQ
jgi:Ciliary basal body-associated, B9 protein